MTVEFLMGRVNVLLSMILSISVDQEFVYIGYQQSQFQAVQFNVSSLFLNAVVFCEKDFRQLIISQVYYFHTEWLAQSSHFITSYIVLITLGKVICKNALKPLENLQTKRKWCDLLLEENVIIFSWQVLCVMLLFFFQWHQHFQAYYINFFPDLPLSCY